MEITLCSYWKRIRIQYLYNSHTKQQVCLSWCKKWFYDFIIKSKQRHLQSSLISMLYLNNVSKEHSLNSAFCCFRSGMCLGLFLGSQQLFGNQKRLQPKIIWHYTSSKIANYVFLLFTVYSLKLRN